MKLQHCILSCVCKLIVRSSSLPFLWLFKEYFHILSPLALAVRLPTAGDTVAIDDVHIYAHTYAYYIPTYTDELSLVRT